MGTGTAPSGRGGGLGPPPRVSVNLVPLLWSFLPVCLSVDRRSTPSLGVNLRADRQEPLPMFRCPGLPGFP
jgi:hypothetical protein